MILAERSVVNMLAFDGCAALGSREMSRCVGTVQLVGQPGNTQLALHHASPVKVLECSPKAADNPGFKLKQIPQKT